MGKLDFIKKTVICLVSLFISLDSSACEKNILFRVQKKIERTLTKDVNKIYWEDSELKILRDSEWWKKFHCSEKDTLYVRITTNDESFNYIEIFTKEKCLYYIDDNKDFFLMENMSEYEEFRRDLYMLWDKNLFKRIETTYNCKIECVYEVVFRFLFLEDKTTEMDYCKLIGVDSPLLEYWFFKSKYLDNQNELDIENFLNYLRFPK
ncbi:MAG: hypothetical protein MJZ33_04610 [Paludibacteraceae bacterium]|nr:hypothetical protein [Paludibacteraceae bacterium]